MKTTLKFGKIDAEDRGCAINAIDIDVELRTKDNGTQVFRHLQRSGTESIQISSWVGSALIRC